MEARDMEQEVPEEASEYQVVEETDYVDSEFDEGRATHSEHAFGENMSLLDVTNTESCVLRRSWELLLGALGERESLGDALYGALTGSLVVLKESFKNPRAVTSLKLFNGFRVLTEKSHNPEELKTHIETLAFKHLGNDITQPRVDAVNDAFLELLEQNVSDLPPGSVSAWQKILIYTGSCFRFVSSTYTERLKVIQEDWEVIQDAEEADTEECVVRSFGGMCAFSNEVMGQETEGWMEELLRVFHVLVERIGNPGHLQEECELLSINMVSKSEEIDFAKFKPVMLAALRSLLPKTWSTTHETAWEWLWETVSRNLKESTRKVRAFKPYNAQLFSTLTEEQLDHLRSNLYTDFFSRCQASQDLFKQSQTRLRYIADRVLQSSYDMFHKPKDEMVDELSALGLRHVGYAVPIELFAPFTDCCVAVMKPLIAEIPKVEYAIKIIWCPADGSHEIAERDVPEHMMVEGFRWSIGLVSRVLMRTITEGSTSVMQAINKDDPKQLRRALREAPRGQRYLWQLRVRVGSQSISPLYWALRSGAHMASKTLIQDILTIRADRDHYYYGVNDLFRLQADVVANVLREAPHLVETLLDGLIWRSHKTQDGLRPVIYYMEHLLQDTDSSQMLSRSWVSFVRFKHPGIIVHPILTFVSDLLWENLVMRFFLLDQVFSMVNFLIFLVSACILNSETVLQDPVMSKFLIAARLLVYTLGLGRLLYWHTLQMYKTLVFPEGWKRTCGMQLPRYLQGPEILSFLLMIDIAGLLMVEPLLHCLGTSEAMLDLTCDKWAHGMSTVYEVFSVFGVFLYVLLLLEVGSVSIELSEYRVLCVHAVKQVMLCFGVVFITILTFAFAIGAMPHEVANLSTHEWEDLKHSMTNLVQLAVGRMDLAEMHEICDESFFLMTVIILFLLLVYSFFFNLLVSQFCGVYSSLAADIKGYARLARGEVIVDTLKAVQMKRWKSFVASLALDRRVDFEEGDLGLAGGVKVFEPALAHPVTKDQIVRFGGQTDPSLPWPEKTRDEESSTEKMIQRTWHS
ncbi:unnamed protein product [Durusdinium trenchii]|uniref:Ion transport domain-containing protein n=1 Tax=Durusdinium trenchii TaxID=1381693 RepID=A0ABP0LPD8_9DINO